MTDAGSEPIEARAEDEFQGAAHLFLTEIDRLATLERTKQELDLGDAKRASLAREVEDVTIGLLSLSRYQTRLIQLELQSVHGGEGTARRPSAILNEWRAAERKLHESRVAMERAADEAERLREEHRHSVLRDQV
jgi:hypothetical protein